MSIAMVDNAQNAGGIVADGIVECGSRWVGIMSMALAGNAGWIGSAAIIAASGRPDDTVAGWWCNAGTLLQR